MKELILPKENNNESIETTQSILFVGANGSGKTRLGTWIEINSPQKQLVHRISAQKSLSLPDSTTPQSIEQAEKDLLFGNPGWTYQNKANKWQNKPATAFLNDYQKLMVYLFSDETEENAKFKRVCKESEERVVPPVTKIDRVKELWEAILPHRELVIGGLRIQTRVRGQEDKIYNSSEMSDGERVIFYLIGQCLAAPKDGIIVIDEPELHLHKSVQAPLWDAVEKLRDDCLFVYLTHDVDFAAAKEAAKRVWLKSFDGQKWEWEQIEDDENLPDDLLIEVLGSRKHVVFVEGENGSFDVSLYRELLSDFLVIPRGSCTQVIQSVKALKANQQIHHLDVYGLIDRDRRVQAEITKLEQDSIYVLNVAEVENLFCTREVLAIVSNRLARDPVLDFNAVSNTVFGRLQGELDHQVSLRVSSEVEFQLNMFDASQTGAHNINNALQTLAASIDVNQIYADTNALYSNVLNTKDYEQLLALYNRKSLSSQVSNSLGLANGSLPETIVRLVRGDSKEEIKNALKPYFGNFQQHMA
ncbi:MAG: AAA family ATPase [Proteobacteria bacterium]|nr:AAA family ATPase [Pseudomonadota bacterium]